MGSQYSIQDFKLVNPDYGTLADLKAVVDQAHDLGMKVILDWVTNHSGWDHAWITEHPEYYVKNAKGEITDPLNEDGSSKGWTDVAELNYDHPQLRAEMLAAMRYWVETCDIDGFRCDVAYEVPSDWWESAIKTLRQIKPLFMLAEADEASLRNDIGFDATYGWKYHHLMNRLANGESTINELDSLLEEDAQRFYEGFTLQFISNHDENHKASVIERMGPTADAFMVLYFTFDGMPLVYNGQEAPLDRSLKEFEKDTIDWNNFAKAPFLQTLIELKKNNQALWNGAAGGRFVRIPTNADNAIFAYYRERGKHRIVAVLNLSDEPQQVEFKHPEIAGTYSQLFANSTMTLAPEVVLQLQAWEYILLSNH